MVWNRGVDCVVAQEKRAILDEISLAHRIARVFETVLSPVLFCVGLAVSVRTIPACKLFQKNVLLAQS